MRVFGSRRISGQGADASRARPTADLTAQVGARGAEVAAVATLRDVTEAKAMDHRLEPQRDEAAPSLKDRILANVSHELRTPLNAILGFSEILSSAELPPIFADKRLEYARIIHASAEQRLEAGRFEIEAEPFALGALIASCGDRLRLKAEENDVEVVADKRACRQILLNLMANAVKFTKPGGRVAVETRLDGEAMEIVVCDTGIGIDPVHLLRIGDPFFRASRGYDRAAEGAWLVGLQGGSVRLESAPGVGARVSVRLPREGHSAPSVGIKATRFEIVSGLGEAPAIKAPRRRREDRRIA